MCDSVCVLAGSRGSLQNAMSSRLVWLGNGLFLVDYLGFTRWRLCVITQFELASTCTSLSQGYCTLQYKAPPGLAPRKTAFRRTVTGGVNNERIVVRAVTNS